MFKVLSCVISNRNLFPDNHVFFFVYAVRASDRDVTYSHIHNGRYEVLDHILVSQEFVRSNPNHIGLFSV